jgi:DNA-binding XRE family transcriptional regulator
VRNILDVIREKSVEEGDCWLWTGYVATSGHPYTSTGGKGSTVARSVATRLGMKVDGKVVRMKCNNKLCVNPAHLSVISRPDLARQTLVASTRTIEWKMKHIAATRRKSKLTMDMVRQIRNAEGFTQKQLAQQYGVHQRVIHNIRSGSGWKDTTNPFALMAMQL